MVCMTGWMTGIRSFRYAKSMLMTFKSMDEKYSQHSRIRP